MVRILGIILLLAVTGCARPGAPSVGEARPWIAQAPVVALRSGEPAQEVDLAAYHGGMERIVSVAPWPRGAAVPVRADIVPSRVDGAPTALRLSGDGTGSAMAFVEADIEYRTGGRATAVLVVDYQHVPRAEFRYEPGSGGASNVSVAGSFNGWNAGASPLDGPAADGSFSGSVAVTPGRHTYKFVVDGAWISDPGNPDSEPDGFGGRNSVLVVAGTGAGERFELLPVPRFGAGGQGVTFLAAGSSDGEPLVPVVQQAVAMAGNRIVGVAPADDTAHPLDVTIDGERITLAGLDKLDGALAPDGIVRVMARDGRGEWARAVLYREPAEWMRPDWRGRSIYFAFIDRFADGDGERPSFEREGEIMPAANYHGGDWTGLRQKIEEGYFDGLGVESLWISAVNRQPATAQLESVEPHDLYTGYHGYWPVSATETNPAFGSMEDLRHLVETAHDHGILVLLDLVTNHVHEDHPWYQENPEWFGELMLPDGRQNLRLFDSYPFTTWFETYLPSFNYEDNPGAVEAVADNAIWWVEQAGIDGFRQDAVKHVQAVFWRTLTRKLRDEVEIPQGRRLYQVGETISGRGTIMEFVSGEMLDGQFDFPLYWTIRDGLGSRVRGLDDVARDIELSRDEYDPESIMSPLIGNHDVSRFMAFADGDLGQGDGVDEKSLGREASLVVDDPLAYRRLMLAHALLMTLPGNPMLYYGDEIGLTGAGDPDNRRPMRFGEDVTPAEREVLENLRALGPVRVGTPALRLGAYQTLHAETAWLSYARVLAGRGGTPDQAAVVIINREDGPAAVSVPLAGNLDHATGARVLYPPAAAGTRVPVVDGRMDPDVPPGTAWIAVLE